MGQPSRKCHAFHTGRESLKDPPRKETEGQLEYCHSNATKGVVPSSERWTHGQVWLRRPVCYPLTGAAIWAALPQSHLLKNTPTQPNEAAIYKSASSGSWAWSLLLSHTPSLVVNMALFSQTKHGLSREVARHTVWCAQTFRLLTGRLNLPVSSPCFTLLMRVYFYQPLWENGPALWQLVPDKEFLIKIEISDHPQSAQPFWVSELRVEEVQPWKELCLFRKQDCSFFRAAMNKSPRRVAKGNYEHLACTELIAELILRRVMFYLDLFSNFWILCFPIEFSLSYFLPHTSSRKYWSEMIKYIFYLAPSDSHSLPG